MSNSSFFDFHCPAGGKWYACEKESNSNFVGCCTEDPCSNGCVQGNIRPAAFNISHHGEWPDASCGSASNFFTCTAGDSFWGCCKSNACKATPPATCAQGDLVPAFMERPEQFNAYTSAGSTPDASSKSNTAAIAGGVVGGVVGIAIIAALIFFLLRRRRNRKRETGTAAMVPMMKDEKRDDHRNSAQYAGQSPPPTYSSPVQDPYQSMYPNKSQYPYQQYSHNAHEPQELSAETASPIEHRYSELAAASHTTDTRRFSELPTESNTTNTRRFSELPADAAAISELPTPDVSPMLPQEEFGNDMAKRASLAQRLSGNTGEASRQR